MRLVLQRFVDTGRSTTGILTINNEFQCFTLEDTYRRVKEAGKTRIPEGSYQIKYREELSPDTKKRRKMYDWFKWHLMLQNVPDFKYIYLHEGNTPKDTAGCILLGMQSTPIRDFLGDSVSAVRRMYEIIGGALSDDEPVCIDVRDEYYFR